MKCRKLSVHALAAVAVAVAGAISQLALAQSDAPPTRAEIKSETRAAEKAGALTPAGEGLRPTAPLGKSTKTRAQRKAETRAARAAGQLEPAGDAGERKVEQAELAKASTKTRAQRKAETRAAARAHELTPAGEGPGAPTK